MIKFIKQMFCKHKRCSIEISASGFDVLYHCQDCDKKGRKSIWKTIIYTDIKKDPERSL